MSNAINDIGDEEKGNDLPLVQGIIKDDEMPAEESQSKTKLFMLYGATVGGMLLIVIIVFIISLKVGGSSKGGEDNGSIIVEYLAENITMKLISPNYKDYISSMVVDGKKVNFADSYTFKTTQKHVVEFKFSKKLDTMEKMFKNIPKLKYANLTNLNNIEDISMAKMFYGCTNLKEVDFGKSTMNIKNMSHLFDGCVFLKQEKIHDLNTSNAIDMSYMFKKCNLTSFDWENFDTQNVETMKGFLSETHIKSIEFPKNFAPNLTDLSEMFKGCTIFTDFNSENLDTEKITNISGLFSDCIYLSSIDLSKLNTKNVNDMSYLFNGCTNLMSINLKGVDTSKVENMEYMFGTCTSLTSLDLSDFVTRKVNNMKYMFYRLTNIKTLDLSQFTTSEVKTMEGMFDYCLSLASLDLSKFDTSNVEDMSYMFSASSKLVRIDLRNFSTKKVKSMYNMFYGCTKLENIDCSDFTADELRNMAGMFYGCKGLTFLDLSNFETNKVEKMDQAFAYCSKLESLDIRGFNTKYIEKNTFIFTGIKNEGKLVYNSAKFNDAFFDKVNMKDWEKEDISEN